MVEIHLERLIEIGNEDKGYKGNNSLSWANNVITNELYSDIDKQSFDTQFDRYQLFKYCNNPDKSDLNVTIAILSWGGMRRDHARDLFKNIDALYPLVYALRNKNFKSRQFAFKEFKKERELGKLPGLGIGYFTKLICFLSPDLKGYIMDQWAGKSINLLTGKEIVKIRNNWVVNDNDDFTYEIFCSHIDSLAIKLDCNGFEAEKKIFSVGGRNENKGEWRRYLINNYQNMITNIR